MSTILKQFGRIALVAALAVGVSQSVVLAKGHGGGGGLGAAKSSAMRSSFVPRVISDQGRSSNFQKFGNKQSLATLNNSRLNNATSSQVSKNQTTSNLINAGSANVVIGGSGASNSTSGNLPGSKLVPKQPQRPTHGVGHSVIPGNGATGGNTGGNTIGNSATSSVNAGSSTISTGGSGSSSSSRQPGAPAVPEVPEILDPPSRPQRPVDPRPFGPGFPKIDPSGSAPPPPSTTPPPTTPPPTNGAPSDPTPPPSNSLPRNPTPADPSPPYGPGWRGGAFPFPVGGGSGSVGKGTQPTTVTEVQTAEAATTADPQEVAAESSTSVDLVLEDLQLAQPATLVAGPAYRVKFRNQGLQACGRFRVALLAAVDGQLSDSKTVVDVPGLAAGEAREVTLRLPVSSMKLSSSTSTSPVAFSHLVVAVDLDNAVIEADKANNTATIERTALEQ